MLGLNIHIHQPAPQNTTYKDHFELTHEIIETPLGPMMAIGDNEALYLLEFTDRKHIDAQINRVAKHTKRPIIAATAKTSSAAIKSIKTELKSYFSGELKTFQTPRMMTGTDFQKEVWSALCDIPYGETIAYADLAVNIGNEKATRAVASANGRNGFAIIIPCHRVISKNGGLGGYAGGLSRKSWLLDHEARRSGHILI